MKSHTIAKQYVTRFRMINSDPTRTYQSKRKAMARKQERQAKRKAVLS